MSEFAEVVDLQDDAAGFAEADREVAEHCPQTRATKAEPLLHWNHWDTIAQRMEQLIAGLEAAETGDEVTA